MTRRDGKWLSSLSAPSAVVVAVGNEGADESLMAARTKRPRHENVEVELGVEFAVPCSGNPPVPIPGVVHGGGGGGACGDAGGVLRTPRQTDDSSQRLCGVMIIEGGGVEDAGVGAGGRGSNDGSGNGSGNDDYSASGGTSHGGGGSDGSDGAMVVNVVVPLKSQCSELFLRSEQLATLLPMNGGGDPRVDSGNVVPWVGPGFETLGLKLLAENEKEGEPWQLMDANLCRDTAAGGWWLKGIGSWLNERTVTQGDSLLVMNTVPAATGNGNNNFIHGNGSCRYAMGMSLLRGSHPLTPPPQTMTATTMTAAEMAKPRRVGSASMRAAVRVVIETVRRPRGRPRKSNTRRCAWSEWHRKVGERTAGTTWDGTRMKMLSLSDVRTGCVYLPQRLKSGVFAGALEKRIETMHKASVKLIVCPKGPETSEDGDSGGGGGGGCDGEGSDGGGSSSGDGRGGDGGGGQLEWEVHVKHCGQGVSLEHAWPILHYFKAQVGDILIFQPGRDPGSFFMEMIKKPVEELSVKASYALPPPLPLPAAAVTAAVEEAVVAEEATTGAAEEAPVMAIAEEMEMEMEMATAAAIAAAAGNVRTVAEATGGGQWDMESQAAAAALTTWSACHWGLIAPPSEPMPVFSSLSEGYCTSMLHHIEQQQPLLLPPQQQQLLLQMSLPPLPPQQQLLQQPLTSHQQQEQQCQQEQEGQGAGSVRLALLSGRKRQWRMAPSRHRRRHDEQHEGTIIFNRPYPGVVVKAASVIGWLLGSDPRLGDSAATATDAAIAGTAQSASCRQCTTITEPQPRPAVISEEATTAEENGLKQSSRSDRESDPWVNERNEAANGGCGEAASQRGSQQVLSAGPDGPCTEARAHAAAEVRDVARGPRTNRPPSAPQHLPRDQALSQQQQQWQQPLILELGMGTATLKVPRAVLPMPEYPRMQRRRAAAITPHPQPPKPLRPTTNQNLNLSADVDVNDDIDIYCLEVGATDPVPMLRPMGPSRGPRFSQSSESIDFLHVLADVAICLAEGGGSPDAFRPASLQPVTQDAWVTGSDVTGFWRTGFGMDQALAGEGHRR
ncbi:hypothetical protein VaNZ11_012816, partial [Volvox africanus]